MRTNSTNAPVYGYLLHSTVFILLLFGYQTVYELKIVYIFFPVTLQNTGQITFNHDQRPALNSPKTDENLPIKRPKVSLKNAFYHNNSFQILPIGIIFSINSIASLDTEFIVLIL
jgi:hypothetical protein